MGGVDAGGEGPLVGGYTYSRSDLLNLIYSHGGLRDHMSMVWSWLLRRSWRGGVVPEASAQ